MRMSRCMSEPMSTAQSLRRRHTDTQCVVPWCQWVESTARRQVLEQGRGQTKVRPRHFVKQAGRENENNEETSEQRKLNVNDLKSRYISC